MDDNIHIIKNDDAVWCGKKPSDIAIAIEWNIANKLLEKNVATPHLCPMCLFKIGQSYGVKNWEEGEKE